MLTEALTKEVIPLPVITAIARVLAMESGARLTLSPGIAYNTEDGALRTVAEALERQVAGTGIDILSLYREGETLVAVVDESRAEEPLCPAAFHRVVRQLSYQLVGEVWDGSLALIDQAPTPVAIAC
jgi:predicted glycoside hydrolase/deacetylase ChbG (UPF0249 family)